MKHKVWFVWGSEAVRDYLNWKEKPKSSTDNLNLSEYEFDTEAEVNAFLEGVDAANGWLEYHQIDTQKEADKILKVIA